MPYVRTLTFTVPPERVEELSPGHNLYLAAVFGTQIAAQNSQGYQKGGVWMQRQTEGLNKGLHVHAMGRVDSMEAIETVPMLIDFMKDVSTYLSPTSVGNIRSARIKQMFGFEEWDDPLSSCHLSCTVPSLL